MNKELAEQINREANIYYKQINGKGCAINSRVTNYSSKDEETILTFYYDHKTYYATYDENKKCTSVKEVVYE